MNKEKLKKVELRAAEIIPLVILVIVIAYLIIRR